MDPNFWAALAGIVWLDLILSGDNAVVIALVANGLPDRQRNTAMIAGTFLAVAMRIGGAMVAACLMAVPGLSLVAGLYLVWVAFSLVTSHDEDNKDRSQTTLLKTIFTIAVADFGMSLDNIVAVAGMSNGDSWLMGFGITLSISLMIIGAKLISGLVGRFPVLTWVGAALLAWVAGGVILHDPLYDTWLSIGSDYRPLMAAMIPVTTTALVLLAAGAFRLNAREV